MFQAGIQGAETCSCIAADSLSNCSATRSVSANVTAVITSENVRMASTAFLSKASKASAPIVGRKIVRVSNKAGSSMADRLQRD